MGLVENITTGKLVYNIMSAFVVFEREMIVECTLGDNVITKEDESSTFSLIQTCL